MKWPLAIAQWRRRHSLSKNNNQCFYYAKELTRDDLAGTSLDKINDTKFKPIVTAMAFVYVPLRQQDVPAASAE